MQMKSPVPLLDTESWNCIINGRLPGGQVIKGNLEGAI